MQVIVLSYYFKSTQCSKTLYSFVAKRVKFCVDLLKRVTTNRYNIYYMTALLTIKIQKPKYVCTLIRIYRVQDSIHLYERIKLIYELFSLLRFDLV